MFWFLSENFSVFDNWISALSGVLQFVHVALLCFYLNKISGRFIVNKINLFTGIIIFKQTNWKTSAATPAKQTFISWNYKLD